MDPGDLDGVMKFTLLTLIKSLTDRAYELAIRKKVQADILVQMRRLIGETRQHLKPCSRRSFDLGCSCAW